MLSPAILALLLCSALAAAVTAAAAAAGTAAAVRWNPDDGGARQLARERRMLLIEAVLKAVLGCQLLSLLLFVATVERLHPLFTGAMCAAGTLNASRFGYPALAAKVAACLLCGLWLVTHRASSAAAGSALIRCKVLFVVVLAGALAAESFLQLGYFADLDPEIITSCCATQFDAAAGGIAAGLAGLPVGASRAAFFTALALTLGAGWRLASPAVYSALAVLLGALSIAAVVSWVAPGFYQLPTHHCPFCLLAHEHGYVGYPLYLLLGGAVVTGAGSGLLRALRTIDPLGAIAGAEERRLCRVSMVGFALFAAVAVWPLVTSSFRLEGY